MFQSILNRSTNSANYSTASNSVATDTSDGSFVQVQSANDVPSLSLKVLPRHDRIGITNKKKSTHFCATVTARELPDDDKRAPVDIVIALDVSGSMCGSKLDLCKTTLNLLLRELSPNDRFGLVTFGSDVNVEIPVRKLTTFHKDQAMAKIKMLYTRGCTNMSGGIGMAAQEMKSIETPHQVQTIFLLTDGHANEGVCDREGIVKLTKGCLGDSTGQINVPIHCFGYGDDHNEEMLRDIASVTEGGTYYYVDSDSNVSSAFGDALGGVLSVVAQNTIVTLKIPQSSSGMGVSVLNVYHEKAIKNPDGSYTVTLHDFYAEESRDIVFEISLSKQYSSEPVLHVISSMSYLDTINSKLVQSDTVEGFLSRPVGNEVSPENQHVTDQWSRVKTTELIKKSESLAKGGKLDTARELITAYIHEVKMDAKSPLKSQISHELEIVEEGLSSLVNYQNHGSKYIQTCLLSHTAQRCSEASEISKNCYRSSKKQFLASKMKNALSKK